MNSVAVGQSLLRFLLTLAFKLLRVSDPTSKLPFPVLLSHALEWNPLGCRFWSLSISIESSLSAVDLSKYIEGWIL